MRRKTLIYNKIHVGAVEPTKKVDSDACWDVYTVEKSSINPGEVVMLRTGIRLVIPKGYEVVVRQRSGLSMKYPNYIANCPGTIDEEYRDEIKILFANHTKEVVEIEKRFKIAQIKLQKVHDTKLIEISDEKFEAIRKKSDRDGGFGSSGNIAKKPRDGE